MSIQDLINGLFELFGGLAVFMHIRTTLKDKEIKGVSISATVLFTAWGYWNLYYYPHLNQWLSFIGGLLIVVGNTIWVILMFKYWKKK